MKLGTNNDPDQKCVEKLGKILEILNVVDPAAVVNSIYESGPIMNTPKSLPAMHEKLREFFNFTSA